MKTAFYTDSFQNIIVKDIDTSAKILNIYVGHDKDAWIFFTAGFSKEIARVEGNSVRRNLAIGPTSFPLNLGQPLAGCTNSEIMELLHTSALNTLGLHGIYGVLKHTYKDSELLWMSSVERQGPTAFLLKVPLLLATTDDEAAVTGAFDDFAHATPELHTNMVKAEDSDDNILDIPSSPTKVHIVPVFGELQQWWTLMKFVFLKHKSKIGQAVKEVVA